MQLGNTEYSIDESDEMNMLEIGAVNERKYVKEIELLYIGERIEYYNNMYMYTDTFKYFVMI